MYTTEKIWGVALIRWSSRGSWSGVRHQQPGSRVVQKAWILVQPQRQSPTVGSNSKGLHFCWSSWVRWRSCSHRTEKADVKTRSRWKVLLQLSGSTAHLSAPSGEQTRQQGRKWLGEDVWHRCWWSWKWWWCCSHWNRKIYRANEVFYEFCASNATNQLNKFRTKRNRPFRRWTAPTFSKRIFFVLQKQTKTSKN